MNIETAFMLMIPFIALGIIYFAYENTDAFLALLVTLIFIAFCVGAGMLFIIWAAT